jgi:Arc/MetJ-type ribon-helix-helix transcriptional regulator
MGRTQIYLSEAELDLLDRMRLATGASRSELIRRAVQRTYGGTKSQLERRQILRTTAGAWRDRPFSGADYVDAIRGDLNERLARLGKE